MNNQSNQKVPEGYKQTDVGVIPESWKVKNLGETATLKARIGWQGLTTAEYKTSGKYLLITGTEFTEGFIDWDNCFFVDEHRYKQDRNIQIKENDILVTKDGTIGKVALIKDMCKPATLNSGVFVVRPLGESFDQKFFYYLLLSEVFREFLSQLSAGSTINHLYQKDFVHFNYYTPDTRAEQTAIATVLSDTDDLITTLEKLIAKKKLIKQGAMQELLTGKRRLPEFDKGQGYKQTEVGLIPEDWEVRRLVEITENLDSLRVPLNDSQRQSMKGTIPYCGANGILDYVNDFVIDDDIILMAEDGGYFDEYETRPIAYRMRGKCWVNNHAHILKATENISQSYLFYSLVHKNILHYINGGTRAKLNKREMNNIEIFISDSKEEQTAIGTVLSDMDLEIEALEKKLEKYKLLKEGMMQKLLTGQIRLI